MAIETVLLLILSMVFLLTAWPVGLFLAYLCKDELICDKKYFYLLFFALLLTIVLGFLFYRNFSMILSLGYMGIVVLVLILRGKIKKNKK